MDLRNAEQYHRVLFLEKFLQTCKLYKLQPMHDEIQARN